MEPTRMRDGSMTADPRLGRLRQDDPRNANFPIRSLLDVTLPPRSYTWSCYARLDQGHEGSCVGHAFAHELAARPVVVPGVTHEAAYGIYRAAQRVDEWEGDLYEGTSVLAGAKVLTASGEYSAYHWAQSEQDIALAVGYRGPVVMGTNWHESMFTPDPNGYLWPNGQVAGGHAWLLVAVNLRHERYTMVNSWGAGWGRNGTAWIHRAAVASLLAADGEALLLVRRRRRG